MKSLFTDKKILLLHLLVWVFYLSYRLSDFPGFLGMQRGMIYVFVPLFFYVAFSYIHYFYLLPLWLEKKRNTQYLISILVLMTAGLTLQMLVENKIFEGYFPSGGFPGTPQPITVKDNLLDKIIPSWGYITFSRALRLLWNATVFILFTSMIKISIERFQLQTKKQQLENEKLITELNYLKAQINPHFLFNTLHNLNSLVYSNSKNAADVIVMLSNIMRYMIYDSSKEEVWLKDEIEYMKDYVHLEGIRLNESFQADFNIVGDIHNVKIAPLILFPFLENAFKHGVSDQEESCWIKTDIVIANGKLYLKISNGKPAYILNREKSGFGLENVSKRLQLSYPEKHELRIINKDNSFEIQLTLKID
ncbi:histidine kinase [Cytophagales bacterium WSM2-2]|nr:histidine kinase [Cytophagales bacterium WSM2-2]